jgi:hypothetical protein
VKPSLTTVSLNGMNTQARSIPERVLARLSPLLPSYRWLPVLLCLALLAGWLLWPLPPRAIEIDLGSGSDISGITLRGFHAAESAADGSGRGFRWTAARQATIIFEAAQRIQPRLLSLSASAAGADAPVPLTLTLNEQTQVRFTLGNEWRHYQLLVPPHLEHPDYSLVAALHTPTRAVAEGRRVGVAVEQAGVRQLTPAPLAGPISGLLLVALGGLLALRRSGLALLLMAGWLLLALLYQPYLLPRWLLLALLVGGVMALWALAVRVPVWSGVPVLLALWLLLSPQLLGHWLLDDAFISLRYAANFAAGHGLVFNPGEQVEGYTNFLWTLLLAGAIRAGADGVLVAAAVPLALAFGLLLLTVWLAARLVTPGWAWGAGLLLSLSAPFLLYTTRGSGMETALFALLTLATFAALAGQHWGLAGLLSALTLLTRPDGLLLVGAGGLYLLWKERRGGALLRYGLPLLVLYGPYFVWRYHYYGYLLPNTFYAKVGGTGAQVLRGAAYLAEFVRTDLLLPAAGGAVLAGLWGWRRQSSHNMSLVALLAGFVVLWCAYVVVVGGDWMPGARFFVPLLAPLVLLVIWGLAGLHQRLPHAVPLLAVALLAGGLLLRLPHDSQANPESLVAREVGVVQHYRAEGRWIARNTPSDALIVAGPAGALPYYAKRPTIDALGLNDEYIAHLPGDHLGTGKPGHEKTDPDYVLGRQPAVVPWSAAAYLRGHPVLEHEYRLVERRAPDGEVVRLFLRTGDE